MQTATEDLLTFESVLDEALLDGEPICESPHEQPDMLGCSLRATHVRTCLCGGPTMLWCSNRVATHAIDEAHGTTCAMCYAPTATDWVVTSL